MSRATAGREVRIRRTVRRTGVEVSVRDTHHLGAEFPRDDEGRWALVCHDHGAIAYRTSLDRAAADVAWPDRWCVDCEAWVAAARLIAEAELRGAVR